MSTHDHAINKIAREIENLDLIAKDIESIGDAMIVMGIATGVRLSTHARHLLKMHREISSACGIKVDNS